MELTAPILAIICDSSSSISSDSDGILFYSSDENEKRCKPRIINYIDTVIYRYSHQEFQENFRLSKVTFDYLLTLIRPDLEGTPGVAGNLPIEPKKQLFIALWFLGSPDSYRSVVTKFGVGMATAWRAVKRVVKAICKLSSVFIKWPSINEANRIAQCIEEKYKMPGVIGAVDGTHIKIIAPRTDAASYVNRKNVHTIQLQVVCNDKLEFTHCFCGMPGSVHDMRVFKFSGLQQMCNGEYFRDHQHILGDSAYTIQKHVMVPYRDDGHLTVEQTHFNKTLSKSRMMVERSIGLLKLRWRWLLDKLHMRRTDLIPYYILCCCVLHNLCLQREDDCDYPILVPEENNERPLPMQVNNIEKREGEVKRNEIKEALNR